MANGIQPHFQLAHSAQLATVERLVRRGVCPGPLNMTRMSIGGGCDGRIRRVPDGASLTLGRIMSKVLPINTMAIAQELGREVATGKEAREIYQLDEYWDSADVARAKLGYPPNRRPRPVGFLHHD